MSGDPPRKETRLHLRAERAIEPGTVLVRGGPATRPRLLAHVERSRRTLQIDCVALVGFSVFAVLDEIGPASLHGILSSRMRSYRAVHLPTAADLTAIGLELLPSFSRPHYTIRLRSDDPLEILRAVRALRPPRNNPYQGLGPRRPRPGRT